MHETLHVRWKPGTLDVLLVTSPHGTLEWHAPMFECIHGRAALAELYLKGHTTVTREAVPAPAGQADTDAPRTDTTHAA